MSDLARMVEQRHREVVAAIRACGWCRCGPMPVLDPLGGDVVAACVVEPDVGCRVRDRERRVWRSWEDALGRRWWGLVDNEDADPLDWASLRSECGPLRLVRRPKG